MDFLPLFLRSKDQRVLVVGGGHIALRKVSLLLRSKAMIRLVAPQVIPELSSLLEAPGHELVLREFEAADTQGVKLVVAATDQDQVNISVHRAAVARDLPVNVVDNPGLCTFIFPSVVDRSPIVIAVSSGGTSPVLARLLRARIESFVPAGFGRLSEFLGRYRDQVKGRLSNFSTRMRFWENTIDSSVAELVMTGRNAEAEQGFLHNLDMAAEQQAPVGEVYLVGAGPGNPDLLTFKALQLMQKADVVLYDRLVSPEILNMCRADAERIHVGKQRKNHTMPQPEISRLLVKLGLEGKRVLRLKGGDPFIFGRGGEEIAELAEHGVPFQVVPGITAASGCAAYAGIPLTHRDFSQSVRFLTGHLKNDTCELDWQALSVSLDTLVFYMGLVSLPIICEQLVKHGRDKDTPVALVQRGTLPDQKVLTGTLATMAGIVAANEVKAPTILIVGDVVKLHSTLSASSQAQ